MRGPGLRCCDGLCPAPRDKPGCSKPRGVSGRAAGQERGRGAEPARVRSGAEAAKRPATTGGLHFTSKGALHRERLVSANESPAFLLRRLLLAQVLSI